MDHDRRKYARAEYNANVLFQCAGQEYVLMARDISAGGLRLDSNPELPPEAEGAMTIPLRADNPPVACRCRVIYSIEGQGIGVEFLDLSEESRLVLNNFVRDSD
jgi:c-di-GMP-binding flagellar brake protein YcgR